MQRTFRTSFLFAYRIYKGLIVNDLVIVASEQVCHFFTLDLKLWNHLYLFVLSLHHSIYYFSLVLASLWILHDYTRLILFFVSFIFFLSSRLVQFHATWRFNYLDHFILFYCFINFLLAPTRRELLEFFYWPCLGLSGCSHPIPLVWYWWSYFIGLILLDSFYWPHFIRLISSYFLYHNHCINLTYCPYLISNNIILLLLDLSLFLQVFTSIFFVWSILSSWLHWYHLSYQTYLFLLRLMKLIILGWIFSVRLVVTQIVTLIFARFANDNLLQPSPSSLMSPQDLGDTLYDSCQRQGQWRTSLDKMSLSES